MRNAVVGGLAALVVSACAGGSMQVDTAADEAAIRDLIRQTEVANNAADSLGWVALFDDDFVYMPPGAPEVTTDADLRAMAATGFGGYRADIRIEPVEITIVGDWAFARSNVSGSVTPRVGGDQIPVDVKQIVLYRRQADGSWKIARLIGNNNS